jgi:ATP-dependent exoDNAse (exonuclease V) beta subunit
MFNHQSITNMPQLPTLVKKDGKHFYKIPQGQVYASITTKLAKTKDYSGLNIWKQRVGKSVATHIMESASINGTATHSIIENYLNNKECVEKSLLPNAHFQNMKQLIDKIDNIHFTEIPLFSADLETAGTCDCIAEYDGVPSIIDFKTSRNRKQKAWIQDYFLQGTAYALMYHEMTGILLSQVVILISGEDGSLEEHVVLPSSFISKLDARLRMYEKIQSSITCA